MSHAMMSAPSRQFIASVVASIVASLVLYLQPSLVSELVNVRHLSSGQAGMLATLGMLTYAFVLLASPKWPRAIFYRRLSWLGAALCGLAAVAWLFVGGLIPLFLCLSAASAGFGLLMLVSNLAIAGSARPAAAYARMYAITLLVCAGLLLLLPPLETLVKRPPAMPALLILILIACPILGLMPRDAASSPPVTEDSHAASLGRVAVRFIAAGGAVIALAFGEVWAFFVLFGTNAGLSAAQASSAAGLSLLGALSGSLMVGRVIAVVEPRRLILIAVLGLATSLIGVTLAQGYAMFVVAGISAMFFLYLYYPTIVGITAELDFTGRGVAFVNGAIAIMAAAGPALAGFLIERGGPTLLAIDVALSALIGLVCFAVAARHTAAR